MKRILLAGASTYGVKNMGDDAMLFNLTTSFHRYDDCEITFLARHPSVRYDELYGIKSIKNYEFDQKKESIGKWFYGFNPTDSREHLRGIREAISNCDLVVIGGNSFMEVSPNQFMRGVASYASLLATLAIFFDKPYVLYGVAGHEIKDERSKEFARYLGNNSELVTVREDFFKKILTGCGVVEDKIKVCGDPAFGMEPAHDNGLSDTVLAKENIDVGEKKLIGVGFRHMYWVWNAHQYETYTQKMARLCDYMIEKLGAQILFIPNCTYDQASKYQDDRLVAKDTIGKMKKQEDAFMIKEELNLLETVSLYNRVDLVVSNRRHSNIFGAIHHKPMFAISSGHPWQFKPFMQDLGLDEHYADLVEDDLDVLFEKVKNVWEARHMIEKQLMEIIPLLKKKARAQAKTFLQLIDKR